MRLYEQALALPREERLRLAEVLIESVPGEMPEGIEMAWSEEVTHRLEQIRSGEPVLEDWEEVRARLRKKYARE